MVVVSAMSLFSKCKGVIEMHKEFDEIISFIENAKAKGLGETIISDKECNEFLNSVYAIQDKKKEEAEKNISNLLIELEKETEVLKEFINEGNALINRWNAEVKPLKKAVGMIDGNTIYLPDDAYYYKAADLIAFMMNIIHHNQYKNITEK